MALVHLAAPDIDAVTELLARAEATDGTPPLSEDTRLALRSPRPGLRHLLVREDSQVSGVDAPGDVEPVDLDQAGGGGEQAPSGRVVGYAQLAGPEPGTGPDPDSPAALELVVDPDHRGRGLGAALAGAAERGSPSAGLVAWAHGDLPAARALARRGGWRRVRELERLGRDLPGAASPGAEPLPAVALADSVRLRTFEVGRDEGAWLALNARAFATHPEQGRWGPADLDARLREPWFDPAGLLLAVDGAGGALLASHWTKVDMSDRGAPATTGEVYVVAVDPAAQGRGLGRAVVLAGLHHLAQRGVRHAELYVDGDNAAARALYARLGFQRTGLDVQYRRP